MKQYIKDNKIYNLPIEIKKDGNTVIYTNSKKILLENGFEEYVPTVAKPTLEQKIKKINKRINEECDNKILNDFIWNGNEFYLSLENQQNFSNLFIAKDYLTYPQTIKTKDGFTMLNNKEEVTEFYLAGVSFIKSCLEECWQKKLDAETEIRKNY